MVGKRVAQVILASCAALLHAGTIERTVGDKAELKKYFSAVISARRDSSDPIECDGLPSLMDALVDQSPNPIFVDVGSNVGDDVQMFLDSLSRKGCLDDETFSIHSFEPNRDSYHTLVERFANHPGRSHFNFVEAGLSHRRGTGMLCHNGAGDTQASLPLLAEKFEPCAFKSSNVTLLSLDKAFHASVGIDILKIDVSGHEPAVLFGARSLLSRHKVKFVIFSFSPRSEYSVQGYTLQRLLVQFDAWKYICFFVTKSALVPLPGNWWEPHYANSQWKSTSNTMNIFCGRASDMHLFHAYLGYRPNYYTTSYGLSRLFPKRGISPAAHAPLPGGATFDSKTGKIEPGMQRPQRPAQPKQTKPPSTTPPPAPQAPQAQQAPQTKQTTPQEEISGIWTITENGYWKDKKFRYEFKADEHGKVSGRGGTMTEWLNTLQGTLVGDVLSWAEFADAQELGKMQCTLSKDRHSCEGNGKSTHGIELKFKGAKEKQSS